MPPSSRTPAATIGVGGLVFDSTGRILLIQRRNPPGAGEWHIPGGRLEPGESLRHCCRREVFEETGLKVVAEAIIAVADRRMESFHYVVVDFIATLEAGEEQKPLQAGSDAQSVAWVTPEAMNELPLIEGLREVVAAGRNYSTPLNSSLKSEDPLDWLFC